MRTKNNEIGRRHKKQYLSLFDVFENNLSIKFKNPLIN